MKFPKILAMIGDSMQDWLSFYDLFSGCGGMTAGFVKAGFKILGGLDINKSAVDTYKHNFPDAIFTRLGSIEDKVLIDSLYREINPAGVIGGAPCQSISLAGNRDALERRCYYFLDFLDFVKSKKPLFFVFENVKAFKNMRIVDPNLINLNNMEILDKELQLALRQHRRLKDLNRFASQRELSKPERDELDSLLVTNITIDKSKLVSLKDTFLHRAMEIGYKVTWGVLNATGFGSGQSRERFISIGFRNDLAIEPVLPRPSNNPKTAQDIIGDLEDVVEAFIPNHDFTKHADFQVKRMDALKCGERIYKNYSDAWRRLFPDRPCFTIKENHGGTHVHYKFPRVLTPREMARFQGFDDSFVFLGSKSEIMKMISNGVDLNMSKAIADSVKEQLCFLKDNGVINDERN